MKWGPLLVLVALLAVGACRDAARGVADASTSAAVHREALDSLFRGREQAARLVLWATDGGDGPVMSALDAIPRSRRPQPIAVGQLDSGFPTTVLAESDLDTLFRRHPDAWAAFFREFPGAPGLVELTPVVVSSDGEWARTWVGRSCGEHCRHAWRIVARRVRGDAWHIDTLHWVAVPAGR